MNLVEVRNKKEQKMFLRFRKNLYKKVGKYIDNNYVMIKEFFSGKTSFVNDKIIKAYYIIENNEILCEGVIIIAKFLPSYVQLSFFESVENADKAVSMLINKAIEEGKINGCKKLVVGLYGHVNYGLGFSNSNYDEVNSFSSVANMEYYNEYFRKYNFEEIKLSTYYIKTIDDRLNKYKAIIDKINKNYTFKCFDKREFDYFSKIYTDLNNQAFVNHRYYYKRNYEEDKEMLKELFLFMKEDSLIFAFKDDKPVAFLMWYPDYNKLASPGEVFGAKHFLYNKLFGKRINVGKVMEYGVIEEYRKVGLPIALINQVLVNMKKNYNIKSAETSWILDENIDSNSFCKAICDGKYKEYVVYEKEI